MTVLNLLAVIADKQRIIITDIERKPLKGGTSTWLWDNNIYSDKNVLHIWIKENLMYVMIKV